MSKISDFVLVYSKNIDENRKKLLTTYTSNVTSANLRIEEETGKTLQDLTCIRITAPDDILQRYSEENNIDLSRDNPYFKPDSRIRMRCLKNVLTAPNLDNPMFERAPEAFSGSQPKGFTQAERILMVENILSTLRFGQKPGEVGYSNMIAKEILVGAYPLHDSKCEWTKEGALSDRQLLAKYWASLSSFYKEQPLNLIEKYYGPEVTFYFAWVGFYTRMLFPAAILGIVCFLIGLLFYVQEREVINEEVCESDKMICPTCPSKKYCEVIPLKNSCNMMKIAYVLDNPATVVYSVFMSFWGVIFMVLWKRKQAMLRLRWNINEVPTEYTVRKKFIEKALVRVSSITNEKEYYLKSYQKIFSKVITYVVFLLAVILYFLGVMLVMLVRLNITYYGRKSKNKKFRLNVSLFESIVSAFLTFFVMCIFDTAKHVLSVKLTEWENPRTEEEFRRDCSLKIITFSMANIFLPMLYLAYVKGHFYTHPGDEQQWTFLGIFKIDICKISGCLLDLTFHLFAVFIFHNFVRLGSEIFWPVAKVLFRKFEKFGWKHKQNDMLSQWEEDFILEDTPRGFLYTDYVTMIIQYGFVSLFVVALPISPALALLNNIIEIRLDAIKYLKKHKRILPRRVRGIEEWSTVLQVVTFLGVISNPLMIAFGSQLVPRSLYVIENSSSAGFINSTLSIFAMSDLRALEQACYYKATRYPPNHERKYQIRAEYWYQFGVKALVFIILENLCLLLCLFLWYVVPELPRKVQIKIEHDQKVLREARRKK